MLLVASSYVSQFRTCSSSCRPELIIIKVCVPSGTQPWTESMSQSASGAVKWIEVTVR